MRALITRLLAVGALSCSLFSQANPAYQDFAKKMSEEHGFEPSFILATLEKANKNQAILDAIARPWEAKPWHQYYPIFLTEKRLQKGLEFYKLHKDTLDRASEVTGVPPEIIVAIIGVETFYGTYKGKYGVLDALYTLGFYYPPRAKFFLSELEEFFLLAREENFSHTELKGSYAGAMGWGQFISSSYRHYAVDFDDDGVRDLLNNPVDAIGSVANYFKRHGWKPGEAVIYPASDVTEKAKASITKPLKYTQTWSELEGELTLKENQTIDSEAKVKLFALEQPDKQEYWLGLHNFYVITRYNHSPLYAMAVYQFSQQIKSGIEQ